MRTIENVMLELEDGSTLCHQGILNDCIYDSCEWVDYPRVMLETREGLETLGYFVTDGVVNVGEVIEFAHVVECEGDALEFWWSDDIPNDAFSVELHKATVTHKTSIEA
jgi:hypothetical protein